jgi:hypothetical protein
MLLHRNPPWGLSALGDIIEPQRVDLRFTLRPKSTRLAASSSFPGPATFGTVEWHAKPQNLYLQPAVCDP